VGRNFRKHFRGRAGKRAQKGKMLRILAGSKFITVTLDIDRGKILKSERFQARKMEATRA